MAFAPELLARFTSPPAGFGPTPLWWWSAEEVTADRLRWQMRRFHDGGIDDLVVINLAPSGPLFGAIADDPPWFGEQWWARFSDACDIAAELGMRLWFYDQIGFSGANLQGTVTREHPWAAGRTLRAAHRPVRDGRLPARPGEELLAAFTTDDGRRVDLGPDGAVPAAAGAQLQVVSTRPTAFDYLDPKAVALLLDRVHGEFDRRVPQHLGTTVVGSFQDELPAMSAWTPRFAAEFRERRGYDLLDHLPALFGRGDLAAARVRADYAAVRAALTEEALFVPLGTWHAERGLLMGADQANPARAGLPLQSTQLYGDYPRTHRHVNAVGSDHEGDAKVHSSLAHLHGHDRVWLEAFHSSGWGGTLEDTWDWLLPFLRSGANLYNPHASYFSTVGGFFEWAPPSTDWRQPYWAQYRDFATAVARVCATLTWGRYEADVAVLHPTATMQAALPLDLPIDHFENASAPDAVVDVAATQDVYLELVGKDDWFRFRPSALDAAGVAFDVLDDAALQSAAARDGRLCVRAQAYSTVLIPSAPFLEQASAQALHAFLDAGGSVVVVGTPPRHATGRAGDDAAVARLVAHPRCVHVPDAAAAVAALPAAEQYARGTGPLLVRRDGGTAVALVGGAYPNATAHPLRPVKGPVPWHDIDVDRRRYAGHHEIAVRAAVRTAQVWDPATGRRTAAAVTREVDGTSRITVETGGAPMVLVAWEEGDGPSAPSAPSAPAPPGPGDTVDVSEGWTGELVPTLDNTWGDLARPAGADLTRLQIWSFQGREDGEPDWTPVRATWGRRVLVRAPAAADRLPPPLTPQECRAVAGGQETLAGGDPDPWTVHEHSASRGPHRDGGVLGLKGRVPEEFLVVPAADAGEEVVVRALVTTDHRGPAELVITSAAPVTAWWDGRPLEVSRGYVAAVPVTVEHTVSVLEYRLGPPAGAGNPMSQPAGTVGSSFTLVPPGGHPATPEYMVLDRDLRPDGTTTFRAPLPDLSGTGALRRAHLVVGTARAATVRLGDRVVARQAKVEYYESEWGATPAFFGHDVTAHVAADPAAELTVELESTDPADLVYVDLAVTGSDGVATLVSGPGWRADTAGTSAGTRADARQWMPLSGAHAVLRPHPLPAADWLLGPPAVGAAALDLHVGDRPEARAQTFRITLPAGTRRVHLPLALPATATVDGRELPADGQLDVQLPRPGVLEVRTAPTAVHRGGAAWTGPVLVEHATAPIALGDWRDVGLVAWSGGVRYRRTVDVPPGRPWVLDLGDLRGAVEVAVEGRVVARAFCAPFRFPLDPVDGPVEVAVTVLGTLGPFLHESTPTFWVFPSQRATGLYGPVCVTTRPPEVRR